MKLHRPTARLGTVSTATAAIPFQRVSVSVGVPSARPPRYPRDFSGPVYLLYLQYNGPLSVSNFETQVSIGKHASLCVCVCVCNQPGAEKR